MADNATEAVPSYLAKTFTARSSNRMPGTGEAERKLPSQKTAIFKACPAQAPTGVLPMIQACPTTVVMTDGSLACAMTTLGSSASISTSAPLCVISFWACALSVAAPGSAQAFRLYSRKQGRMRPARPAQTAQRGLPDRTHRTGRNREQPAWPFDHHAAGLGQTGRDQSDAPDPAPRHRKAPGYGAASQRQASRPATGWSCRVCRRSVI